MPLSTQTKMLRVLEEREFFRVGGEKSIRVDVRVIAASNQELRQLVEMGDFRRDLYFRLNVLRIELPPLRDRKEDIPLLVHNFIEDASTRHDRPFAGISENAMRILLSHVWPGNIRELRNLVESMVLLAPGRRIEARDIPAEVTNPHSRGLLSAPAFKSLLPTGSEGETSLRPELEFVFRTLVNLRMDVDDLRRDFDRYRETQLPGSELVLAGPVDFSENVGLKEVFPESFVDPALTSEPQEERRQEDGIVVYRPGMTIEDMEEEAIRAVLEEVGGNRRKAAERLDIGERTLYRKIKKYGLDE